MGDNICQHYNDAIKPCVYYVDKGLCKHPAMFRCIKWVAKHEPQVSYSSMKDWGECKRKYWWKYIVGLENKNPSIAMVKGRIASEILGAIHQQGTPEYWMDIMAYYQRQYTYQGEQSEVAKDLLAMEGLFRVYTDSPTYQMVGETEAEFHWQEDGFPLIHGYLDYLASDRRSGYEFKYTSKHGNYGRYQVADQLTTYLLGIPELEQMTVRTIQVPQLRKGERESDTAFMERVQGDVAKRKSYYIKSETYYRGEFLDAMEEVKEKAKWQVQEMMMAAQRGMAGCYTNRGACWSPFQCEYISVCENGVVSESLYQYKEKKEAKHGKDG